MQANAYGGLSERARRRALEIANDGDLRIRTPKNLLKADLDESRTLETRIAPREDPRLPIPDATVPNAGLGREIETSLMRYLRRMRRRCDPASGPTRRFAGAPFSTSTTMLASLDSVTPYATLSNPFPQGYAYPEGRSSGLLTALGSAMDTGLPAALETAYNQQWNFTIQRALSQNFTLQVAYAGNKGTHLAAFEQGGVNADQLPVRYMSLGQNLLTLVDNPYYGKVKIGTMSQAKVQAGYLLRPYSAWESVNPAVSGVGNSNYHSLQAMMQKRFAGGTSLTASYTWSKTISDVTDGEWSTGQTIRNYYCLSCERSVSLYDVPHRLTAGFTSELPFGKNKAIGSQWPTVLNTIAGGWQANVLATLASGQPLAFGVNTNTSNSYGGGQHPDATGVPASLGDAQSYLAWFNTAAYAAPATYTFGNVARTTTSVRRDLSRNVDFSLFKTFSFGEKFRLEFRAEAFNLTNTCVFAAPTTKVGNTSFGVITAQNNTPRQMQLGMKLSF
jgi:hypothetical protein